MVNFSPDIQADIDLISRISVVPNILDIICHTTGMGFAAVARVTDEKWVICSVKDEINFGLKPGGELVLESTICHEIRQSGEGVIIDSVVDDENFRYHHTPAQYGFQSYISIPIRRKDGSFFGTLCAIDPRPAQLNNPQVIGMFKLYADLISFHMEALEELDISESNLVEQQKIAEVREQFIAILGHDLRNPLGAISGSAQLLARMNLSDKANHLAKMITNSSFRMKELIENILDFASGRLGEGIILNKREDSSLNEVLNQVIDELRVTWPDRSIETEINLTKPVNSDSKRIAQLFSNLLSNALTHGDESTPIRVTAKSRENEFELCVANRGDKISDEIMPRLFQPFSRGEIKQEQQGLGLGLYIAAEIARAHNGTLNVTSTDDETCFTLRMPLSV